MSITCVFRLLTGHVTPQSALASIVSLLLRADEPAGSIGALPTSPGKPLCSASRWLWTRLHAVSAPPGCDGPSEGDEVDDENEGAENDAMATAPAQAILVEQEGGGGWEVLEGDEAMGVTQSRPAVAFASESTPATRTTDLYHDTSAVSNDRTVSSSLPPLATQLLAPKCSESTLDDKEEAAGSWSLVDEAHGRLRRELIWVAKGGDGGGFKAIDPGQGPPQPPAATRVLGNALIGLLSTALEGKQRCLDEAWDARRFYPSSLAVLLTRPLGLETNGGWATLSSSTTSQVMLGEAQGSATALRSSGAAFSESAGTREFLRSRGERLLVVVEKNFRVYAYTRDDLHVALLALFCKVGHPVTHSGDTPVVSSCVLPCRLTCGCPTLLSRH